MTRSYLNEFYEYLNSLQGDDRTRDVSVVTGELFYNCSLEMADAINKKYPNVNIRVYKIINDFFGHTITVTGLLVGRDIIDQLKGKELGDDLLLPANTLKFGEDIFLDDVSLDELKEVKKKYAAFREKTLAAGGVAQMTFTMKNGATLVLQNAEGAQARELRTIADTIGQKYKQALVIVGTDRDGKRSFVVKMVGQLPNTNAAEVAKQIAAQLNGRAGGRPDFAQGGGEAKDDWQAFMNSIKETI